LIQIDLATDAKTRALSDKNNHYLLKLGLDIVGLKKGKREYVITTYFDDMQRMIVDNTVLNLVAIFEKEAFASAAQASKGAKVLVDTHYDEDYPYAASIENFIKTPDKDINKLAILHEIADGCMTRSLSSDLKEIIKYRNRVAHGKRFGEEIGKTVKEIMETLDQALVTIRGN
jgi:uncharacterized protein (UPF0210 family)